MLVRKRLNLVTFPESCWSLAAFFPFPPHQCGAETLAPRRRRRYAAFLAGSLPNLCENSCWQMFRVGLTLWHFVFGSEDTENVGGC